MSVTLSFRGSFFYYFLFYFVQYTILALERWGSRHSRPRLARGRRWQETMPQLTISSGVFGRKGLDDGEKGFGNLESRLAIKIDFFC